MKKLFFAAFLISQLPLQLVHAICNPKEVEIIQNNLDLTIILTKANSQKAMQFHKDALAGIPYKKICSEGKLIQSTSAEIIKRLSHSRNVLLSCENTLTATQLDDQLRSEIKQVSKLDNTLKKICNYRPVAQDLVQKYL